jgi:nitroreductase
MSNSAMNALTPGSLEHAILTRKSVRAFTQKEVSRDTLLRIIELACRAPSGTNTQPWRVYVLQGAARESLVQKVCKIHDEMAGNPELAAQYKDSYDYYPEQWISPFIDRRRENGWSLYGLLGIAKGEKQKMHVQQQRNFRFFDAPVGLMFTLNKIMGRGSLVDYGMFLENLMLAARSEGLSTCPQAAWLAFSKVILPHIGAADNEMLVCGMSLGYADENALVNTFSTPRESAASITSWV